ncbi:MetQ/NlpA family ABC transporter substrate-binding protein [Escherichia coli]
MAVGNTFVYPIAGYSKKSNHWMNCRMVRRLPCQTTQLTLAGSLLLLQKVGLIKLKDGVGLLPTVLDVVENPKKSENC